MIFGKMLRQLREEKGLTQKQLAEKLFVTDSGIRSWESGRSQPNLEMLCEIAKVFDVTVGQLLGVEEY